MARTRLLLAAMSLGLATAAPAAPLDPQPNEPYRWRVVLDVRPHPHLPPGFRTHLASDVRAALLPALGPLGTLEVIDLADVPAEKWEPVWKAFADRGWPALDGVREITGVKTHFLRVECRDGAFHLESRQTDGDTGLASPLVRRKAAATPEMAGRLAGLMLDQDFGPVGTVESDFADPAAAEFVRLRLKASGLGPVQNLVKPGDVFLISLVREPPARRPKSGEKLAPPPPLSGSPRSPTYRDATLLRVADPVKDGACRCQVLSRLKFPFGESMRGVAGVRAMRLATVAAPVSLRLVDNDDKPHAAGQSFVQVRAGDTHFAAAGPTDTFELRDGLFRSLRPYPGLACVTVSLGADRNEQFPVAVLGDDPVVLRFAVSADEERRVAFERRCESLHARMVDAVTQQLGLVRALDPLIRSGQHKEATARATAGKAAADALEKELTEELKKLRAEPGAAHETARMILDRCDDRLAGFRKGQATVAKSIEQLKEVQKVAGSPERIEKEFRAKQVNEQIKEMVERGDVPEALELYAELVDLVPGNQRQEIRDRREKLAAEWTPTDDAHKKARDLMLVTLPEAKTAVEFRDLLDPLRKAADTLYEKRDRLGLRKMLNQFLPAYAKLEELIRAVEPTAENAEKQVRELEVTSTYLKKTETDTKELLRLLLEKEKK